MNSDALIKQIDNIVQKGVSVSPNWWIEKSLELVSVMSEDTDLLYSLQRQVAEQKVKLIESGKSTVAAKTMLEATELYENTQKQKAKLERINELIRLSKIQSRQRVEEYLGGKL